MRRLPEVSEWLAWSSPAWGRGGVSVEFEFARRERGCGGMVFTIFLNMAAHRRPSPLWPMESSTFNLPPRIIIKLLKFLWQPEQIFTVTAYIVYLTIVIAQVMTTAKPP